MTIEYPHNNPDDWDKLTIGEFAFPGTVQFAVPTINMSYEVIKQRGHSGASMKFVGMSPRTVDVSIMVTNEEEWDEMQRVISRLPVVSKSNSVKPLGIQHPMAAMWGIDQVLIASIAPSYPDSESGWFINMTLIEVLEVLTAKQIRERQRAAKNAKQAKALQAKKGNKLDPTDRNSLSGKT